MSESHHQPTEENLRDHAFDGIQEYDNPMPAWWKRLFWGTFWFSVLYIMYFHSAKGRDVLDEYDADMQAYYEKQTADLLAMGEVTEAMLGTLAKNNAAMNEAKATFSKTCNQCHKADASGDIGPNLTDNHWLGGNSLMDLYKVIKDGRNKMPPWGKKLSPDMVMKMAAYVGTLRGTMVPGKAPEGKELPVPPIPAEAPNG